MTEPTVADPTVVASSGAAAPSAAPVPAADMLAEDVLLIAAYEWDVLTRFAQATFAFMPPGETAKYEAARYARYSNALTHSEWKQVQAFAQDKQAVLERRDIEGYVARHSDEVYSTADGITFDTEGIGQLWRLLFGFAAQYSRYAERLAGEYLRETRSLTEAQWQEVDALLTQWEDARQ